MTPTSTSKPGSYDLNCHYVDLLACWLGEVARVTAISYNTPWSAYKHDATTTGIEPGINGRNNLQTLAVCEMLVRSARERHPIERAELG